MKIVTEILFHAILAFIQFQHAAGAPMRLNNHQVFVQMGDFSNFEGIIKPSAFLQGAYHMPLWMHHGEAEFETQISAFILTQSGEHYDAVLKATNQPEDHDPHPTGPVICELRLDGDRHFSTALFEEYKPPTVDNPNYHAYPLRNRIYVTLRGGPIYSAVLLAPHEIARSHPNSPSSPHSPNSPERRTY